MMQGIPGTLSGPLPTQFIEVKLGRSNVTIFKLMRVDVLKWLKLLANPAVRCR